MEMEFYMWLQDEMNRRGLSQADLSRMTGLTTAGVSLMFTNKKAPRPETLNAIARAFEYPPEFVFRLAGLLPEEAPTDEELIYLYDKLTPDERSEIKAIIRIKLSKPQGEKNAKNATGRKVG